MKQNINGLNLMQLFERIIDITAKQGLKTANITRARPYLRRLSERLQISEHEALMLAACVNLGCDDDLSVSNLAEHFGCTNIKILTYWKELLSLNDKRLIFKGSSRYGGETLVLPSDVLDAFRDDRLPEIPSYEGLSISDWFDCLFTLYEKRNHEHLSYTMLEQDLQRLISSNPTLPVPQRLRFYHIDDLLSDTILLLGFVYYFLQNGDEYITWRDLENFCEDTHSLRTHVRMLESGEHLLQKAGLIEFSCADGQVVSNAWKLTERSKRELLEGMAYSKKTKANLINADAITPKQLFFPAAVEKQVAQLRTLFCPDRFSAIQERLVQHGMRRGFACIFYGAPGTGKTETALQLARETGRAIKMVDVPNLRSKWVGETEKNIKAVFNEYRQLCIESGPAPILLFNEADAVLCKRSEGAVTGVDKMENAMQNIILQEMETLDGIMVATTNLTGNLDAAFERRFLYKIEFPKPTPEESRHIWHAMLPKLTDDEAYSLACDYPFSGGQIENIARKYIVNTILSGQEESNLSTIREACRCELFHRSSATRIGFAD